ncbi:MAG: UDP-N-acetylmuramoyl-L-alanyl-D-glutamate--2,6-diaminopimelate ligase, partial [Clostridia bacterium]|nr:UDP-N-acetylmuramoyl-L-alanyl-D-glutamate--2,6-diaminopimelate ligase [Clostridia bacterium]
MKTNEVLKDVKIIKIHGALPGEITAVCDDSKKTVKGSLFFVRKGNNSDGADYVAEAVGNGASAVIGEKYVSGAPCFIEIKDFEEESLKILNNFYQSPQKKMKMIGVVGTNGKTSVCHILSAILSANGIKTGRIGTIGVFYGDKRENSDLTTPGRFELFRLLKKMCD